MLLNVLTTKCRQTGSLNVLKNGLGLILLLCLVGCAARAPAPVINKSPNRTIPAETRIQAKDSIYTISWQYGLDFLDIAKWNGLKSPYRLKPGQRLRLRPGKPAAAGGVVVKTLPRSTSSSAVTSSALPASTPLPATTPAPSTSSAAKPASRPTPKALASPRKWQWPARGEVIAKYSRKTGVNGIRIAGAAGTPVRASAAGDVVYVGEGLRGYGKLIIVKHSAEFLSAYAHNRRILVGEGERVASNQQIAEMGSSGAERTMLHFEIRVNGKPEDPLKYLR